MKVAFVGDNNFSMGAFDGLLGEEFAEIDGSSLAHLEYLATAALDSDPPDKLCDCFIKHLFLRDSVMRVPLAIGMSLSLLTFAAPASATVIISGTSSSLTGYNFAPSEVIDFNSGILPSSPTFTGNGGIENTSVANKYQAPDSSPYFATSNSGVAGFEDVKFGSTQTKFGLYWGSIDSYNTITFFLDGVAVPGGSFTGSAVASSFVGVGNSNISKYVNFSGKFDEIQFSSSKAAFEIDNLAVSSAVPEPSTWALMLAGFAGLGFAAYRQTKRSENLALA